MLTTKQKIINASIELFSKKGYTETTIKEIASLVNIKAASLYNHFNSKSEILTHILNIYIDISKKNTPTLEMIDSMIKTHTAREILNSLFYEFKDDESENELKILKIVFHEQFRVEKAHDFMKNYFYKYNEIYVESVLNKLKASGKIKPINAAVYAKIINSLNIAASGECMFYTLKEYKQLDRIRRKDVIAYLIDEFVADE